MVFGKKGDEVSAAAKKRDKAAKKDAKRRAKGQGVNATNAGRIFRGAVDEIDHRRNGGR